MRVVGVRQGEDPHGERRAVVVVGGRAGRAAVERSGRRVRRLEQGAASATGDGWRMLWPDLAEATRAGTWGDGGRDY